MAPRQRLRRMFGQPFVRGGGRDGGRPAESVPGQHGPHQHDKDQRGKGRQQQDVDPGSPPGRKVADKMTIVAYRSLSSVIDSPRVGRAGPTARRARFVRAARRPTEGPFRPQKPQQVDPDRLLVDLTVKIHQIAFPRSGRRPRQRSGARRYWWTAGTVCSAMWTRAAYTPWGGSARPGSGARLMVGVPQPAADAAAVRHRAGQRKGPAEQAPCVFEPAGFDQAADAGSTKRAARRL